MHLFHTMKILAVSADQALTVQQIVFDEGIAYAGCFTLVVWTRGDTAPRRRAACRA